MLILRAIYYEYYLFQRDIAIKNIAADPDSILRLQQLPQSAQKSAQWHNESLNLLTGHEFGSVCYGTLRGKEAVMAKKCGVPVVINEHEQETHSQIVFTYSEDGKLSPFKWGWRFEPVVRDLYERCWAEGSVFDGLGRIRHPVLPRLAASPDGLITSGPRSGRLIEIKSPITREITGIIPDDYYCQMQLQAEVCDVEAVDYIEMRFTAILLKPDTANPTYSDAMCAKNPWMGKICVVANAVAEGEALNPETYTYAYSPLFPSDKAGFTECCAWLPTLDSGKIILEESIWYVYDYFTTTLPRNRRWWADVGYPAYVDFWRDVDIARKTDRFGEKALFIDTTDEETQVPRHTTAAVVGGWEGISESSESENQMETTLPGPLFEGSDPPKGGPLGDPAHCVETG